MMRLLVHEKLEHRTVRMLQAKSEQDLLKMTAGTPTMRTSRHLRIDNESSAG